MTEESKYCPEVIERAFIKLFVISNYNHFRFQ